MSLSPSFSQGLLDRFIHHISSTTGLQIRPQDAPTLCQKIIARCRILRLTSPEQYYELLINKNAESFREWQALIGLITTGESYFFRDRGQVSILRDRILPELIERQRRIQPDRPTLRVWSAGCSTGEEAYSLAIVLTELIPDWERWDLTVIGTDINQTALEKARQGRYSNWSFRWVDSAIRNRYFEQQKNEWKISDKIAKIVQFRYDNLVEKFISSSSDFPFVELAICRNVFVYFDFIAIDRALQKICQRLNVGGYLISGHTELHGQNLSQFRIKIFPESVAYQRCLTAHSENSKPQLPVDSFSSLISSWPHPINSVIPAPVSTHLSASISASATREAFLAKNKTDYLLISEEESQDIINRAELLFKQKQYIQSLQIVTQLLDAKIHQFSVYYLTARIYANLGNLQQAIHYSNRAIELSPLAVQPYLLLAHIAEEEGNIEKTKNYLKKAIYLEPQALSPYLELGALYAKQGEANRARKMWEIAVELLQHLPPQAKIESDKETTVAELIATVRRNLRNT